MAQQVEALLTIYDVVTGVNVTDVTGLAQAHHLPTIFDHKLAVQRYGGLMSYGTDQDAMFGLAAAYVDRILRGDKPADIPVQAPTRYQTAVNLKTARELGLTVPPGLLVAADEVIE